MHAYTPTNSWLKTRWRSGLALVCSVIAVIPASAVAEKPVLHPGSQRYKVSAPPSTGRSGSATLTARALLGRGGETTLEVSTSTLDSAALAPGNISKLQIKLLDAQGRARGSENHNRLSLGGRLQLTLGGLGRGQPLQLQANIEGIDRARTGVVTLRTEVRRRPDLAVQQLTAPESAQVGMPVPLSALVVELSGDTGAEADCVLKVDGAEVDRAPGVWIDAAGAVSCAFSHTFSRGGAHVVSVEAAEVVPADDDDSNNQAQAIVQVTEWLGFHHEARVDSVAWRNLSRTEGWYARTGSSTYTLSEWSNHAEHSGWRQTVQIRGELADAVSFPLSAFELTHSSGGEALPGVSFYDMTPDASGQASSSVGTSQHQCVLQFDPPTAAHLTLCTRHGLTTGQTSFTYTRYGGEVTYFSGRYQETWITDLATGQTSYSVWSDNRESSSRTGAARWVAGPSYDFDIRVLDGTTRYRAASSVTLTPYEARSEQPYTCYSYSAPGYSTVTCRYAESVFQGARGSYVSSDG